MAQRSHMVRADQLSQVGSRKGLRASPLCRLEIQQTQEPAVAGYWANTAQSPEKALAPKQVKTGAFLKSTEEKKILEQVLDPRVIAQSFTYFKRCTYFKRQGIGTQRNIRSKQPWWNRTSRDFQRCKSEWKLWRSPLGSTLCWTCQQK